MGKDASASRYEPPGWSHWPALPGWSAQFLRVLGVAQEGAASIGECLLAASRMSRMAGLIPHIRCPYLIVRGEYDFLGLQTAVDAATCAREHGVAVDFKVFRAEETGASHCQADNPTLGQEWVWDWLATHLA